MDDTIPATTSKAPCTCLLLTKRNIGTRDSEGFNWFLPNLTVKGPKRCRTVNFVEDPFSSSKLLMLYFRFFHIICLDPWKSETVGSLSVTKVWFIPHRQPTCYLIAPITAFDRILTPTPPTPISLS